MIGYGIIVAYDRSRRAGVLKPDIAGAPLVFTTVGQPQLGQSLDLHQRYRYTLFLPREGGQPRAVNLIRQLTHREQAEAQAG